MTKYSNTIYTDNFKLTFQFISKCFDELIKLKDENKVVSIVPESIQTIRIKPYQFVTFEELGILLYVIKGGSLISAKPFIVCYHEGVWRNSEGLVIDYHINKQDY